ncbi:MAG: transglycosylase domain-containing protein [Bacteroides sp.]|jgi:penicillin-binding protein 1A|nr:transglycosylase domain-containing protein [Bacteroides sp.]
MNKKRLSGKQKYLRNFWLIVLSPFALLLLLILTISIGLWGFMPTFEELENPRSNLASEIYSADGELLGTFYIHNRQNVKYEEITPNMVHALLATEDIRFHHHSGVDVRSIFRVIIRNILGGQRSAGGGSTLSQQLAKNLFPRGENPSIFSLGITKLKEWVTAAKLERNYTKEEIIAMYLNTVDFGSHAFGIKSAAKTYFNTSPDSLKVEEAAMLVGMLKAPSWFHPVRNPDRAIQRRQVVLSQMARYSYLSPAAYDSIRQIPLDMSQYQVQDQNTGLATYFREYLRMELNEWSTTRLKPDGSHYNIYKDGLKIYTTLDSRMQRYAEEAVAEHMGKDIQPAFFKHWEGYNNAPFGRDLTQSQINTNIENSIRRSDRFINMRRQGIPEDSIRASFNIPVPMTVFSWDGEIDTLMTPLDSIWYYKHFLNTGLMAVEPQTGYVKAYVGGINFLHFKYDHVTASRRQVGSTFKPFLYTLAMQEGEFSPCTKVPNTPVTFDTPQGPWTPKNSSDDREGEMVTLKWALANSVNYVSAFLMKKYSPLAVINLVRRMGITGPIDPVPALALGTPDISVSEMVGAFSTFANKGVFIEPTFITHIEDKNGNLIEAFMPRQEEAMSEETAYLMLELMKGVVESGTGMRLRFRYGFDNPIAGKTGTTQNQSDGWFMGVTPQLATGVWVGAEDRGIRFRSITLGQGANTSLPIWALFMQRVYADETIGLSKEDFEKPSRPLSVETDCNKYEQSENPRDVFQRDIF